MELFLQGRTKPLYKWCSKSSPNVASNPDEGNLEVWKGWLTVRHWRDKREVRAGHFVFHMQGQGEEELRKVQFWATVNKIAPFTRILRAACRIAFQKRPVWTFGPSLVTARSIIFTLYQDNKNKIKCFITYDPRVCALLTILLLSDTCFFRLMTYDLSEAFHFMADIQSSFWNSQYFAPVIPDCLSHFPIKCATQLHTYQCSRSIGSPSTIKMARAVSRLPLLLSLLGLVSFASSFSTKFYSKAG